VRGAWLIGGVACVVVLVAVAIAVIGSGAGTTTPGALPGELSEDQAAQLEEFQSCMRDQGVELPEPGESPTLRQGPGPEMLGALQACAQHLPEGFGPGGGAPGIQIVPGS
jgi:hypothetical protein